MLDTVILRLNLYFDKSNLGKNDVSYVQLIFFEKDKKLLSEFFIDKEKLAHISDSENNFTNKIIPVSVNEDSLGKALNVVVFNDAISIIPLEIGGKLVNFLDIIRDKAEILRPIHKDKIIYLDSTLKFYLHKDKSY